MPEKEKIDLFIAESEGLINKIEELILSFEKNPKNPKTIEELYFVFNGLTRLIGMLELENYQTFVTLVEKLLEEYKDVEIEANKVNEFFDLMLQNLEILKDLVGDLKEERYQDLNIEKLNDLKQKFEDFKREYEITFIKPLSPKEIDEEMKNKNFYKIYIKIADSVKFKKVRLFFIFRALNNLGRLCYSKPEPEILEKGEFETDFEIYFMTKSKENEINEALDEILEINSKFIKEIDQDKFKEAIVPFGSKKEEEKLKLKKEIEEKQTEKETLEEFLNPIDEEEIKEVAKDKRNIFYKIYVRIKITCKHKVLRTFFIFRTLNEIGRICWSNPSPSKLEQGEYDLDFEVYYISKEAKEVIRGKIGEILDIANKAINEISPKDFERIIRTLREEPKVKKKEKPSKKEIPPEPVQEPISSPKKEKAIIKNEVESEIVSEIPLTFKDQESSIIFTDPIENYNNKVAVSNFHFLKLLKSLSNDVVFSCHPLETSNRFLLYIVFEGIIFYTVAKEYDLFKERFNIYKGGFTEFHNFLQANKYGITKSIEFQAFKDSEYFSENVMSYNTYLKKKKST
ncbi:MAG: hypothetical protein BAJALOKI2v1_90039 [Promethearchaeota archaeon]|nr:MAG: hypothetical protein BAJALOKI2v1_90039 [Candidatus Lokiarchaeota archaeon]